MTNDKIREEWKNSDVFNFSITDGELSKIANWWLSKLDEAREEAFGQGVQSFKEGNSPMGVSQWQNHGAKFGYAEYFDERERKARADERKKVVERILAGRPREKAQLDKNDPDNYGACYAIAGFNAALSAYDTVVKGELPNKKTP